jgi:hypothetical protein
MILNLLGVLAARREESLLSIRIVLEEEKKF